MIEIKRGVEKERKRERKWGWEKGREKIDKIILIPKIHVAEATI